MADKLYDALNPLEADDNTGARLDLQADDTAFIGLTVWNQNGGLAVQANGTRQIQIGSAGILRGIPGAIEIKAALNTTITGPRVYNIYNDGSLSATAGYGIKLTETGTTATGALNLFNSGSINTTDPAVWGGSEDDSIVNTGVIRTTGTQPAIKLDAGNDSYDGSAGVLIGKVELGTGNDTAYGGMSSEIFSGDAGDDYIDGGGGLDTVDFAGAASSIMVDLRTTTWQNTGEGQDLLLNVENLIGSDQNDRFVGNSADNNFEGGKGGDELDGGAGTDSLKGGDGNDTLEGGGGDDILDGGHGAAGGEDWVRYRGTAALKVNLALTGSQNTIGYGNDTLISIEHVEGGDGADTITGNTSANKLLGNFGSDTLSGGGGNDTIEGGSGTNTAVFNGAKADYEWTTTADANGFFTITHKNNGADGVDKFKEIRFLKFLNNTETETDDVTVALSNQNPASLSLSLSSVSESTAPNTHVATVFGSDPDGDQLTYELLTNPGGLFTLNGTSLVLARRLDFETNTSHTITVRAKDGYGGVLDKALTIKVTNDTTETTPIVRYGTAAGEEIVGEYGSDRVYGLDGNDRVFGLLGNDTLDGGNGDDFINGGNGSAPASGNDVLYGSNGNDSLYGADGQDVFVFNTKLNAKTNVDFVIDFTPADDTIHLSKAVFSKIASKGVLKAGAFVVGNHVRDKQDRILYEKSSGALFYDPDGTGKAKAVQFATVAKNLALTNKDFFVI